MQVDPKKFSVLANWQREYTMEYILTQLKKEMASPHNRKLVQPPEGTFFWNSYLLPHLQIQQQNLMAIHGDSKNIFTW